MNPPATKRFIGSALLALAPLALLAASATGCKERCQSRLTPDGTADFSSLRLAGQFFCAPSRTCQADFSGSALQLTYPDVGGKKDVITYAVAYQGTHEQTQNALMESGGLGECDQYRRETWDVPTVKMTFSAATRDGQPLAIDESGQGLSPSFRELTVISHYVDRTGSDEYVGVLVRGVPVDGPGMEESLTRTGNHFFFVPESAN